MERADETLMRIGRGYVVINFGEEMYRAFGELLHTVRTGETAFDRVYGAPLFEYYAANPDVEASAAARMLARTLPVASAFAASDVVRHARTLVDVGGGAGTLLAEVLCHRPELRGVGQGARLAIVELLLPERMTPSGPMLSAALLDLIMLVYAGGRERTEAELTQLLDQARLRLVSTTPLAAGPQILEAVAV